MKISHDVLLEAEELQKLSNDTLDIIFSNVENLVKNKKYNLAHSYVKAMAIDMLGKTLNFPNVAKQDEVDYLAKWIAHRYGINLTIKVNDEH